MGIDGVSPQRTYCAAFDSISTVVVSPVCSRPHLIDARVDRRDRGFHHQRPSLASRDTVAVTKELVHLKTRQPLILTAQIPETFLARFDRLRQIHFPPDRNFLRAHLTMFHRLPG